MVDLSVIFLLEINMLLFQTLTEDLLLFSVLGDRSLTVGQTKQAIWSPWDL